MSERGAPGGGARGGPSFGERRLAEETRERFLREIVARVPLDRLAAVHLFRPIRQGGFESGVAVVAAEPPAPEPAVVEGTVAEAGGGIAEGAGAEPPDATAPVPSEPVSESADVEPGADAIAEPACDPTDAAAGPALAMADAVGGPETGASAAEPNAEREGGPAGATGEGGDDATVAADTVAATAAGADDADRGSGETSDDESDAESIVEAPAPEPRPARHTVFMARYRLAIKGPDRGKWDVEVVEEADAPMVTVEAVVRGVQRRAGDEGDPERLDAAAVARLVALPGAPAASGVAPP